MPSVLNSPWSQALPSFCGSNPAGTSQAENVYTHDIVWYWRLIACGIWPGSSELAGERDMKMRTG